MIVLEKPRWQQLAAAHAARAKRFTAAHLERRARGQKHAIEDFLFTYYSYKPALLAKWHPGVGITLADASAYANWRYYHATVHGYTVDIAEYFRLRAQTVSFIRTLLSNTLANPPRFGCFGLHEWAMVYKLTPEQLRHQQLPLRLGGSASDRVVEEHRITCTHFDAYRFFTPAAVRLNTQRPTRQTQITTEQAGCLHAGMDVYKWAVKLGPLVSGELLLDCFELARDIRYVDMQASPYDVSSFGLAAIPIETAAGKREYLQRQQEFTRRGNLLRKRLLAVLATAEQLFTDLPQTADDAESPRPPQS